MTPPSPPRWPEIDSRRNSLFFLGRRFWHKKRICKKSPSIVPRRPFGWHNCLRPLRHCFIIFRFGGFTNDCSHTKNKQKRGEKKGKKGAKKGEERGKEAGKRQGKKGEERGKRVYARNRHNVANLAFWQGSCALVWAQIGSFLPLWPYKRSEGFLKAVEVKWHIPSPCLVLMPQEMSRISSIKGPDWPLRKTQERQFTTLYLFHAPTGNREKKGGKKGKEGCKREQEGRRRGGKKRKKEKGVKITKEGGKVEKRKGEKTGGEGGWERWAKEGRGEKKEGEKGQKLWGDEGKRGKLGGKGGVELG